MANLEELKQKRAELAEFLSFAKSSYADQLSALDQSAGITQTPSTFQPTPKLTPKRAVSEVAEAIAGGAGYISPQAERKVRGFIQGVKHEGPLFIGEEIGERVGSKFGKAGSIIGAGQGRATADAFVQIYQQIMNKPDAPNSTKEAATRLMKEWGIGAGTQGVTEGAIGVGRKLAAPFAKNTVKNAVLPDFAQIEALAKQAGIDLTPAQRTASRGLDNLENYIEKSIAGGGRIRNIKEIQQPAKVRDLTSSILNRILPEGRAVGRSTLGEMVDDAIVGSRRLFKDAGSELYENVDRITSPDLLTRTVSIDVPSIVLDEAGKPFITTVTKEVEEEVGGALVDLRPIKDFAGKLQKKRLKEGGASKPIDSLIDDILSRPDQASFQTAHSIRSDFLEQARNAPSRKDRLVGIANKVSGLLDGQMELSARAHGKGAEAAWRNANEFWATGKAQFDKGVVKRIAKEVSTGSPDRVVDIVFARKSPDQVKQVMQLIDDPVIQDRLKRSYMEDLFSKSSSQIPGDVTDKRTIVGKALIDRIDEVAGDGMLEAVYGKTRALEIQNLARLAKATQGGTGGVGGILAQALQLGPAVAGATGAVTGNKEAAKKGIVAAATIAAFGESLSKMISSPKYSKLLTDTAKMPPGSKQAAQSIARISRILYMEKSKRDKEKVKWALEDRRKAERAALVDKLNARRAQKEQMRNANKEAEQILTGAGF